ncbi:MAG: rod shape-determining protein RodA [Symploca sp. SIO2G7]|nr:rod shape-determining protein RodA [Symploca sp. SIO2G7]
MLQKSLTFTHWKSPLAPWKEVDWLLFGLVIALTFFGGVMIHTTELNQSITVWFSHWVVGSIGLLLALFIARSRYEVLIQWHWIIYGITNLSLIAVMIIGATAKGAQRWITIGGFNLQPSEFAKLGLIITLAAILHARPASTISAVVRALSVTVLPWALVFLQPDLGTSLVFGAITLGMLYWGNANPGWLVLLVSPLISAILFNLFLPGWFFWAGLIAFLAWRTIPLPWENIPIKGVVTLGILAVNLISGQLGNIFWGILKDYQKSRLTSFLNPDEDPLGAGYHLIQSRIAIGGGELLGRGLNQGPMTQLNFVPEQHTDFIFSAIGEQFGFVGCLGVLFVFWLICLRLVIIAQNAKDNFGSLVAIGVLSMIVFQVIINISMTVGLAPVTGIPLPWMSYGRSAILTNFLAIGLVESVANHRHRLKF